MRKGKRARDQCVRGGGLSGMQMACSRWGSAFEQGKREQWESNPSRPSRPEAHGTHQDSHTHTHHATSTILTSGCLRISSSSLSAAPTARVRALNTSPMVCVQRSQGGSRAGVWQQAM